LVLDYTSFHGAFIEKDENKNNTFVCNEYKNFAEPIIDNTLYGQDNIFLSSRSPSRTHQFFSNIFSNKNNTNNIPCIAWSSNGQKIASISNLSVCIWDAINIRQTNVLERHTDEVVSVCFMDQDRLLASLSLKGTLVVWRTDTWEVVAHIDEFAASSKEANIAYNLESQIIALPGASTISINIWELDVYNLCNIESSRSTVHYANAKVVLLGESGVGKSGLGMRIAEGIFKPTESTHGAQFWHMPVNQLPNHTSDLQGELTLWDLAGQPEYRLIHQLFLDDCDAALLLFDCSDPNDPFRGVLYWAKVLKKHAPKHTIKLLVSARCDVSPVTVDRPQINQILALYNIDYYFKTSAKDAQGVDHLYKSLLESIRWDLLPRTSTPKLFQVVRDYLLEQKECGLTLIPMDVIQKDISQRYNERPAKKNEIDAVVSLLQARGLVYRLDPRRDITLVLTRPEVINQYASSIIQAARNHQFGIGAVLERDVLIGNIPISGYERLPHPQETIILEATVELMIRHDLCFREMGLLIFPSQINVNRPRPKQEYPKTEVAYRFSGSIESIYASLVVRLSHTNYFRREEQWKYAVEFSRGKELLGFTMRQVEEGTGELEIHFDPGISEFDKVTFIRFVTDHLRSKGIDIQEKIRLYCPKCDKEVISQEAIEARVIMGCLDIPCQYCTASVLIPKSIEERYRQDMWLAKKQWELGLTVEERTEKEIERFKAEQQQYSLKEDYHIKILHLSDLHLENEAQANIFYMQLETDLTKELKINRLKYLVISGDIGNYSTEDEYKAAFHILDRIVKRFGLDADRVIIVPGNHDLNWNVSEEAYPFVLKRKLPNDLLEGMYIQAGDFGVMLRDEALYQERFTNFNTHFYKRVYGGREYPLDYSGQAIVTKRPEDRILFLALNSSWQIDKFFKDRAGIHMEALSKALDSLNDEAYEGWLKIAVCHHPVTGKEMINNEFMQLLAIHGFRIFMHGHIHEAIDGFYKYDEKHGIHVIGAGTFGAPAKEQVSGIPLQYNFMTLDPNKGEITVKTRKKEKPDGAWSADARWGDKVNDPKPWYKIQIQNYHPSK
jgi:small GTP-binding protein